MKDYLGFRPKYSVLGTKALPTVVPHLMLSSVTIREGGATQQESGALGDLDAASADFWGYCVGFQDKDGYSYDLRTSGFSGTYTQSPQGDTYAASASNDDSGGDNVVALTIPAFGVVCSGYLDATAGTTTGSNVVGYYLDIVTTTEEYLDESSSSTTIATFKLMPGVSTRLATDPEHPESTRRVMVMGTETEQGNDA